MNFIGLSCNAVGARAGENTTTILIIAASTANLIRDGYLTFVVFAPSEPDLAAVRDSRGRFS